MNDTSTTAIIKNDRTGRTRYPVDFKSEVLAAFDRSSLSGLAFAEQHGIKYPNFNSWLTKRRKQQVPPAETSRPFILAEIASGGSEADGLHVQLPGGAIVTATTPEATILLAQLVKALA
jgi:hypothetical protein